MLTPIYVDFRMNTKKSYRNLKQWRQHSVQPTSTKSLLKGSQSLLNTLNLMFVNEVGVSMMLLLKMTDFNLISVHSFV